MFSNNDNDFKEIGSFLLSCMMYRIDDLSNEYIQSNEYLEFYSKYSEILKKLANLLPSETFALVLELDSIGNKLSADNQNFFYKKGFFDCRTVFKFLDK